MAYGDFKYLAKRIASDNVLRDKAFRIAKNPIYDGYQSVLFRWLINFLIKNLQVGVLNLCQIKNLPMIFIK